MQPFGSQPFQSFVFWLKAHNKKGKPLVYTVPQIVGGHSNFISLYAISRGANYLAERVSDSRKCFHSCVLVNLRLDLRRAFARTTMARHSVFQYDRHYRLLPTCRNAGYGSFFAPSTVVHRILDWRKYGAFDHGMDGGAHIRQC